MIPARLLLSLAASCLSEYLPNKHHAISHSNRSILFSFGGDNASGRDPSLRFFAKRDVENGSTEFIVFACLIPVLVILSGIFAGLTLGYMSMDETQLQVLSISGTPKQREYANKIKPIRKNGHLLLVTLLLANMIVNETLPVISDPVLGGGVPAVVVSTVLIVLFAEIIPQSVCTRHGLYIGAKMAGSVRILIYIFGIVAWPVAKFLEFILGPHHGIIYRRAELKELIALHGSENPLGGDLRTDTVTIIGATLDLQDKTVRNAMTPIDRIFMLHIDAKLDYDTLRRICATGHSRIPVYEIVELKIPMHIAITAYEMGFGDDSLVPSTMKKSLDGDELVKAKVKKIIGILLVKQCVLLDPEDAVPVRKMRLNKVPFVPQNEPLLGMLDRFQEGRSHLAIVSRLSVDRAQSVKKAVRKGLTQRLLGAFHGDSSASDSSTDDNSDDEDETTIAVGSEKRDKSTNGDNDTAGEDGEKDESGKVKFANEHDRRGRKKKRKPFRHDSDLEKGSEEAEAKREKEKEKFRKTAREQRMPADAVLSKANAEEYLATQGIDPAIMPLGIITLEDVLEELIGEEIYDEFDVEGKGAHSQSFVPPGAHPQKAPHSKAGLVRKNSAPELHVLADSHKAAGLPIVVTSPATTTRSLGLAMPKPIALPSLKSLGFLRSRSAPPMPRDANRSGSAYATPPGTATPIPTDSAGLVARESTENGVHPPMLTSTSPEGEARLLGQIAEGYSSSEKGSPPAEGAKDTATEQKMSDDFSAVPIMVSPMAKVSAASPALGNFLFPNPGMAPTPRSASPVPSLESILLERRRRGGAAVSGAGGTVPSVSVSSGIGSVGGVVPGAASGTATPTEQRAKTKGWFKSSPLASLGADASVVVAEEIKKQREKDAKEILEVVVRDE